MPEVERAGTMRFVLEVREQRRGCPYTCDLCGGRDAPDLLLATMQGDFGECGMNICGECLAAAGVRDILPEGEDS